MNCKPDELCMCIQPDNYGVVVRTVALIPSNTGEPLWSVGILSQAQLFTRVSNAAVVGRQRFAPGTTAWCRDAILRPLRDPDGNDAETVADIINAELQPAPASGARAMSGKPGDAIARLAASLAAGRPEVLPLTPRQAEVLEFIEEYREVKQMPPTRVDIARHFGWASPNAAEEHLQALARKGAIVIRAGCARGIFVTGRAA